MKKKHTEEKRAALELMELVREAGQHSEKLIEWSNNCRAIIHVKVQHIKAGVANRNGRVFEYAVLERFVDQINQWGDMPMMVTKDITRFVDIATESQSVVGYIRSAEIVDGEIICDIVIPDSTIRNMFRAADKADNDYTLTLWYGDIVEKDTVDVTQKNTVHVKRVTFANCTGLNLYQDPRKKPSVATE